MLPEEIKKFIDSFSKLPSVGPRMATRLVFFLLGMDKTSFGEISSALVDLDNLDRCKRCFFFKEKEKEMCQICRDKSRNAKTIALVEKETDIISIEKIGSFKGHYLIIGELPEKGSLESIHKLRIGSLKNRIENELGGKAEEIIIALNPSSFGDFMATIIKEEFKNLSKKITRIGRGLPTGGEVEFADEETLKSAINRRE